jgi:hypothetical protein
MGKERQRKKRGMGNRRSKERLMGKGGVKQWKRM